MRDQVEKVLAGLGDTAGEIAQALEAKGVTGGRSNSEGCPLVKYLSEQFPECRFAASHDEIALWEHTVPTGATFINTSPAMREFVLAFDRGEHPMLDRVSLAVLEA